MSATFLADELDKEGAGSRDAFGERITHSVKAGFDDRRAHSHARYARRSYVGNLNITATQKREMLVARKPVWAPTRRNSDTLNPTEKNNEAATFFRN